VIHKNSLPLRDPSGVEQSNTNNQFTNALFNLQLRGATHLYSITAETLDSVGVLGYTQTSITNTSRPQRGRIAQSQYLK
jgi:hypothetical protein